MQFLKYLLSTNPGSEFKYYLPVGILIISLILGAVVFSIIYDRRKHYDFAFKRLFRKTSLHLVLFAMLFLFLIATRYEGIPYFSMRILMYLSLLGLAYFFFRLLKTFKVIYPRERQNVKNLAVHSDNKEPQKYTTQKRKR